MPQNLTAKKETKMDKTGNVKEKPRKSRFLITFICIFLSVIIVVGGVFGIIAAVRESRSVAKYGNAYLDGGAAKYLSVYYKHQLVDILKDNGIVAYDSYVFWQKEAEEGKTYGDILRESFGEYISSLLVANAIYDSYASFKSEQKEEVRLAAEGVLQRVAGGSVEKFNELAEIHGFDYDDFLSAAKYLYKAQLAKSAMYGADGSGIAAFTEDCKKYLSTYTHVDLIFIRLEDIFVLDGDGNMTYDDDGQVIVRPLTAEESAERQDTVNKLNSYIAEGIITPETFEYYLAKSDGDADMSSTGYYFNKNAEATVEFAEQFPEVVELAYGMDIGGFAGVECPAVGGYCFIYKYNVAEGAYANTDNPFFSDFYSDAAAYMYPAILTELSADAKLKDSFYGIDIVSVPKITDKFVIDSWN